MNSPIEQPNWTFRSSFVRTFWVEAIGASILSSAMIIGDGLYPYNAPRLQWTLGLLVVALLLMDVLVVIFVGAAVAVLVYYFTIEVNSIRIRGYNDWGWYFDQEWSDIAAVRPINICGLRYLRLSSKTSRKAMKIPLFLANQKHFWELAIEFTEPDNPLHQFARAQLKVEAVNSAESVPIRIYYH